MADTEQDRHADYERLMAEVEVLRLSEHRLAEQVAYLESQLAHARRLLRGEE